MAKAKISSLSNTSLYFGDKSGQNTLTAVLDLSEISGNSNYKYAWFAYIGSDRENYYECVDPKKATSSQSTVTIDALTDAIPDFPSNSTTSTAYVEVVTYNSSGVEIGSHRKKFSAKLHADVKPTVGDVCFNPANTANGYNLLLSNFNAFSVKIGYSSWNTKGMAWKPTPGSSIVSYTISSSIRDDKFPTKITTSKGYYHHKYANINLDTITTTPTFTITMTDSRGRTCEYTKTYSDWRHYSRPVLNGLKVFRSNSYGNPQDDGRFACIMAADATVKLVDVARVYGPDGRTNINADYTVTFQLDGSPTKPSYETNDRMVFTLGDRRSHCLGIDITDAVGGKAISYASYINSINRVINICSNSNGDVGIAFGVKADNVNEFFCAWDIECEGNIECSGTITSANGTCQNSDARLKTKITDLDVDIIDNLRPVKYELIQAADNKTHFGFIAQDVVCALSDVGVDPELTGLIGHTIKKEQQLYTLAYDEFIPFVVKKCQELQKENNEMRAEIAEIKQLLLQASSE